MKTILLVLPLTFLFCVPGQAGSDWPWWRGPHRNGIADADQKPPTEFSADKNVVWVAPVPGRGHGSPTVSGTRVFLAVADEEKKTQGVLCVDRATGKELWAKTLHEGGFPELNKKASHASCTPACDGERIFVGFVNGDAAHLTALSVEGKELWRKKVCDFVMHQGYGSSPTVYENLVIVTADNKGGGAICAYDRKDGSLAWKVDRPKLPNYNSPIIHRVANRDQMIVQGCNLVVSIDPKTGKKIWECPGSTEECVASMVTDGERIFTSGGYPKNHVVAMTADGSGKIEWENTSRIYVPSMLFKDGHLFAVMDNGLAMCWNSKTGETLWKERLGRDTSSSPVMVGNLIYSADEYGQISICEANPKAFKQIATNKLGDEIFSSPSICGGRIYIRVTDKSSSGRQEKLYCLGTKE